MNEVFKLYRLQQVDSQLDLHTTRLQEIEAILEDDTTLQSLRSVASGSAESLNEAQRELRQAEHQTQAQRTKIKQTETKLYSGKVTNPKELQDLQNEAAALKRYLAVLEDRQLEAMLAVDDAESHAGADQSKLENFEAEQNALFADLRREQAGLTAEVQRVEQERAAASTGISAETLAQYEKLRKKRQGVAVARVVDQACSACGSTLSSTLLQEARSPDAISHCAFCGRILYAS